MTPKSSKLDNKDKSNSPKQFPLLFLDGHSAGYYFLGFLLVGWLSWWHVLIIRKKAGVIDVLSGVRPMFFYPPPVLLRHNCSAVRSSFPAHRLVHSFTTRSCRPPNVHPKVHVPAHMIDFSCPNWGLVEASEF